MWQRRWLRAEAAFTDFAHNEPQLFAEAGFPEAFRDDGEDRFDPHDVIYKIPEWRNDFGRGIYHTGELEEEDNQYTAGARAAAFESLTEGLAPHEREAQGWDGYYNIPELTQVPLEVLSRQSGARGGDHSTFNNNGEEFTARRGSDGGWIVEGKHGEYTELPASAAVWIDSYQYHQFAEAAEKEAEAAVKRAEAAIKKADAKKADADARKAEADKAAETARAEANRLSSEAAATRLKIAEAAAEKARAEADKATAEKEKAAADAEKTKAEHGKAKEETRKARAEADKAKAERRKERVKKQQEKPGDFEDLWQEFVDDFKKEDENVDPLIQGARDAAFESLTEGLAPHEREAKYWDGHYPMPELEKRRLGGMAKDPALRIRGGHIAFTNAGEMFVAYRDSDTGEWIVGDMYGTEKTFPYGAEVWVDKKQDHLIARNYRAKRLKRAAELELGKLKREVAQMLAKEFGRLNFVRGSRTSTLTLEANKWILNIIEHTGKDLNDTLYEKKRKLTEFYQTLGNPRIRNNRDAVPDEPDRAWVEERGALPEWVVRETTALFEAALAGQTSKDLVDLMDRWRQMKGDAVFERKMQVFAETVERRGNIEKAIVRMDPKGRIRHEMGRPHGARVRSIEDKGESAVAHKNSLGEDIIWSALRPERIFAWFDGTMGKEHGLDDPSLLMNLVFNPVADGDGAANINSKIAFDKFAGFIKGINPRTMRARTLTTVRLHGENDNGEFASEDVKINYAWAMYIYQASKDEDSRRHLLGSGFTEDDVNGRPGSITLVVDALPQKYKDAVDKLFEYYRDDQFPRVNDVFEREHNVPMVQVRWYAPIRNLDLSNRSVAEIIKEDNESRRLSVKKGATKGRMISYRPFNEFDFFTINLSAMMEAEKYIALNDAVRNANRYLLDERLSKAMKIKSEAAYNELLNWLNDAIMPDSGPQGWLNKVANTLGRNYAVARLAGNIVSMMKQPMSWFQASPYLSPAHAMKAAGAFMGHPIKTTKMIREKSALMWGRADSIERVYTEMAARGAQGRMNKILKGQIDPMLIGPEDTEWITEMSNKILMGGLQVMDVATAYHVWLSKYSEVMEKTKNEKGAIAAADRLVRRTQSQGGNVHLPRSHRERGIPGSFTMFTNDANQALNLLVEVFAGWKNRGPIKNAQLLITHTVLPVLLSHIITQGIAAIPKLFKGPGDEPDDPEKKKGWKEWQEWLAETLKRWSYWEDMIDQIPGAYLGGIPVVNDLAEFGTRTVTNQIRKWHGRDTQRWFGGIGASPIQGIGGDIEDVVNALSEGKDAGDKALETYLTIRGIGGYVPYKRSKGAKESGDPRRAVWSEYTLEDRSVEAAMVKRAAKHIISKPDEFKQFVDWYEKLGAERWYDKAPNSKDTLTAGERRQQKFVWYYERALDKIMKEDPEKGFRLLEESRALLPPSKLLQAEKNSLPNSLLLNWGTKMTNSKWWQDEGQNRYSEWVNKNAIEAEEKKSEKTEASEELYRRLEAAGRR
jgi:hypothetical protein